MIGLTWAVDAELFQQPEIDMQLFNLGRVVATPAALQVLEIAQVSPMLLLGRHLQGDWGDLDDQDRLANDRALVAGSRLFPAYVLPTGEKVWAITEAGRSSTCLLLPDEY